MSDLDLPQAYVLNPNFFPHHLLLPLNHRYLSRSLQSKPWVASPAKRNSELINSLLGLPKNMESAGK